MDKKRMEELGKRPWAKIDPDAFKRLTQWKCTICNEEIKENDFKNAISIKEYRISGMCQTCQDSVFGGK